MKLKKNHLLWNYWANFNQTLLKWSLGGPLLKLCPSAPSCIQDGQFQPNFAEMILRWSPFKFVSVSAVLYPEISSNGQNCSILSQKVPKFELYKHNDELFNMYYGIFYELWTFTDFDRLWNLKKGGMKLKKNTLLWNYWANFNQTLLKWSLGGPLLNLCPSAPSCIQDGRHY